MAESFFFIIFINKKEFGTENRKKNTRSSKRSHRGYALFCPTPESQNTNPRVNDVLSKSGIHVIRNRRVSPQNTKFEALEIIINTDSRGIYIKCTHLNLEVVRQVFKRFSRIYESFLFDGNTGAMIDDSALNLIETLLVSQANMPFRGFETKPLLHFAMERGHRALFELLLKCGADVNGVKNDGSTPLHAVVNGQCNTKDRMWFAQKLLKTGANVNAPTKEGFTPLHKAAESSYIQMIRLFLKNGADVNATTKNGTTPLIHAFRGPEILKLLVEKGAAVDAQSTDGRTVLLETVKHDSFKSAEFIMSLEPSISVRGNRHAFYAALGGCQREHAKLARLMIMQGFTVSSDAKDDPDMIFGAIHKGLVDIVPNLLQNGIAVNHWLSPRYDSWEMNPLFCALQNNRVDMVELLLQHGADVNVGTRDGLTPLHDLARNGRVNKTEKVKLLLQYGANVHATDSRGATPLIYYCGYPNILRLLIENGAAVDAETADGQTVLLQTVKHDYIESAEYILSLKPSVNVSGNRRAFYASLVGSQEEHAELARRMFRQGFAAGPGFSCNPTIVFDAINTGSVDIVEKILNDGAPVNQWNFIPGRGSGNTPLHYAIECNRADIVEFLLERGADVNASGENHGSPCKTPMSSAVQHSSLKIVKMIYEAKATDRVDPKLLFIAVRHPNLEVLEFLLQEGLDPNFKNKEGRSCCTFLDLKSPEIVNMLTKYDGHVSYDHINYYPDWCYYDRTLQVCLDHCPVDASVSVLRTSNEKSARHLIKLKALLPEVSVPESPQNDWHFRRLVGFKDQCELEAQRLDENIGKSRVKYRDILTSKVDRVSCFARNTSIAEALEPSSVDSRFPIYASMIKCKYQTGVLRRNLVDEAVSVFRRLVKQFPRLPDVALQAIIRPLRNRDLVILQKCLPAVP